VAKNLTGRQLARVSAIRYRETVWSDLYLGSQHTVHCLRPAVLEAEKALELSPTQRKRTVWRLDGGAGSDEHVRWLLARDYHLIAKGMSNRRTGALATQARRWDAHGDIWLGEVAPPVDYGRPVRVFVKRRLKKGKFATATTSPLCLCPPKATLWPATMAAEGRKWSNSAMTKAV
jgi:hypothetical protein